MTADIHYEIYCRHGQGGWALVEAEPDRKLAIRKAQDGLGQSGVVGVKVTKETFNAETGTFASVAIFESGDVKPEKTAEKPQTIPCFKPQDLYTRHARAVIGRVLKETLEEWQLVPMELIHRADMLEKLEARSTVLQHAVQQVAIAQSSGSPGSLHEAFRLLMDLALRAMDRVVQDSRKNRLMPLPNGSVAQFWAETGDAGDGSYLLAAAIALYLKDAVGWDTKLAFLLQLLNDLPTAQEQREQSLATIDAFIAEMIRARASLHDLLGECKDLGHALRLMTMVFLGKETQEIKDAPKHLAKLTQALSSDLLDESRSALAERILVETTSMRRLHPGSFREELESMRYLAQQLVLGVGPHLRIEQITEAFAVRSKRLVTPESIEAYLEGAADEEDKIDRLIELEENVVGAQSKRTVAGYLLPILASNRTEFEIGGQGKSVMQRLRRVAELQAEFRQTHFDEKDKQAIQAALDLLAIRIADRHQFFRSIETRPIPCADKTMALLRLIGGGDIPEGECMQRAKTLVAQLMRKGDFSATLMSDDMSRDEKKARMDEFKALYAAAGLAHSEDEQSASESAA